MSIESMARFGALLCDLTPRENYARIHTAEYFQQKLDKAKESQIIRDVAEGNFYD